MMGMRRPKNKLPGVASGSHAPAVLREKSDGRKQTNINAKSMMKLEHVRRLAVWASGEASISSLGAFFGNRLAALGETLGAPHDPSLLQCQRCESILHPGDNCTVRIEKNRAKARRRSKKLPVSTQNYVVYKCHFCSHRNQKRGTPRGHMKEMCPPKAKHLLRLEPLPSVSQKPMTSDEGKMSVADVEQMDENALPVAGRNVSHADSPATPLLRTGTTLLEAKRRKRNRSGTKKAAEPESSSTAMEAEKSISSSRKRKRKSWTSLKEIAESSELKNNQNFANLTIPFLL